MPVGVFYPATNIQIPFLAEVFDSGIIADEIVGHVQGRRNVKDAAQRIQDRTTDLHPKAPLPLPDPIRAREEGSTPEERLAGVSAPAEHRGAARPDRAPGPAGPPRRRAQPAPASRRGAGRPPGLLLFGPAAWSSSASSSSRSATRSGSALTDKHLIPPTYDFVGARRTTSGLAFDFDYFWGGIGRA